MKNSILILAFSLVAVFSFSHITFAQEYITIGNGFNASELIKNIDTSETSTARKLFFIFLAFFAILAISLLIVSYFKNKLSGGNSETIIEVRIITAKSVITLLVVIIAIVIYKLKT